MNKNNIQWTNIGWIAYTENPGLINCLLVAKLFAQTLSFLFNKPLIPVNHVYAHIFSIGLTEEIKYPFLGLVISGKTTSIFFVKSTVDIQLIDSTKDNAIGEAYDKVGRIMGLNYPAGPEIDNLFNEELITINLLRHNLNPKKPFSYSGIITASNNLWNKIKYDLKILNKQEYLSTIFQKFVIQNLLKKIIYFSELFMIKNCYISGGVAANKYLIKETKKLNINIKTVDKKFAGDNAAMIAYYAWLIIN